MKPTAPNQEGGGVVQLPKSPAIAKKSAFGLLKTSIHNKVYGDLAKGTKNLA